jgi:pyruvate/2-oxoglutarate dehydrogenase complex dihydrolipoamide dehydrogenase (E3) component
MKYDLAIIGAGSAGLSIAAAAAQFGQKVVLFEKGEMGGDCLNSGCIPSKALLAAAKNKLNFAEAMAHVQRVIAEIAPHDSQERFESLGVDVVRASAQFISPTQIEAADRKFEARKFVIATGSRAAIPKIQGLSDVQYLTNETLFQNPTKPKHLIIIGGGPIGMEMAQAHIRLGCAVTVLEAFHPMVKDDPELVKFVVDGLTSEGVEIRSQVKIQHIEEEEKHVKVILENGEIIAGSHILIAAGRKPNIENLNLTAAGISYTEKGIDVDNHLRTSNAKVYVAGDAANGLQFTHVAGYHAGLIIRNALFKLPIRNKSNHIPWVTYTDPELAHVGLSEKAARSARGDSIRVIRMPFSKNDRAQAEGKTAGLIKIVTARNGRILGASIGGPSAGELIGLWVLAVNQGLKISSIANMVLPYPTLNEISKRAAVSFYAQFPKKPWLRKLIDLLKKFG